MGTARIRITPELLRQWIPLPVTTVIAGSLDCYGEIEILLEDPDLPTAGEGEPSLLVTPTFRRNPPVEFVKWGL